MSFIRAENGSRVASRRGSFGFGRVRPRERKVTAITHLDQQLAALGASECSIESVQPARPCLDQHRLAAGKVVLLSAVPKTLDGQGSSRLAAPAITVAAGALHCEQAVHVPNPSTAQAARSAWRQDIGRRHTNLCRSPSALLRSGKPAEVRASEETNRIVSNG